MDFGVEPLAGTSASRLVTISMYLFAFVAAVRFTRLSVNGVCVIKDLTAGVSKERGEGSTLFWDGVCSKLNSITAEEGDLSFVLSGVEKSKLFLLLIILILF